MKRSIIYFDDVGEQNTDKLIDATVKRAEELGIKHVVVASTSGATAIKMAQALKGKNVKLISVTHQYGLSEGGKWDMDDTNHNILNKLGAVVTTQSHLFSGVERAISKRLGGASRIDVISDTLRAVFGKGFKVALEVAMMAADSGHIPVSKDTEIIAVGGTRYGADVALVVRPAHSHEFFSMQVREIIAMPRAKED
ncbi:MAG: pyruvate kinase alpha/beta domain-containing protein [Methanosarcinaceae archaeon]